MTSLFTRRLLAAEGLLELGLPVEAEEELERLEGDDRTAPEVWAIRCKIYRATEQWGAMRDVAKHLVSLAPSVVENWIDAAFAARRAEGVEAAEKVLRFALKHHPDEPSIHYQLACFAAQQGHFDEASDHLRTAVQFEYELKHRALQDPDLQPLWEQMGI